MKGLEYTRFATVTIYVAQILSGLVGLISIITGVIGLIGGAIQGLNNLATGIVFFGIFFAFARILNIENPAKDG